MCALDSFSRHFTAAAAAAATTTTVGTRRCRRGTDGVEGRGADGGNVKVSIYLCISTPKKMKRGHRGQEAIFLRFLFLFRPYFACFVSFPATMTTIALCLFSL